MPIIFQKTIYRDDIADNPGVLYVYADNAKRTGAHGLLAQDLRDAENAIGVRLKWLPGQAREAYFTDHDYEECCSMIDEDLVPVEDTLETGGIVVFPSDGIESGGSKLKQVAPRVYEYLIQKLDDLFDRYMA